MKKLFPYMTDRPETGLVIAGFVYWFLGYCFVPFGIVLITAGLDPITAQLVRAWLEIAYHFVNGVIVVCIMYRYLSESFYKVTLHKKSFIGTVAAACGLMLAAAAAGWGVMALSGRAADTFHAFPVVDQNIFLMTDTTLTTLPIPGALCMVLLTPVAVSCMFYAIGFAPSACKRTWLGYVMVTFVFIIFHLFEYCWHLDFATVLTIFLLRLPVHLIACWSYQKTNTVWAPIVSLSVFNILASLAYIVVM